MEGVNTYFEQINIHEKEKTICKIVIDQPPVHSLSGELLQNLKISIEDMHKENPNISLCYITSTGDKFFIAGANIKEMQMMNSQQAKEYTNLAHKLFATMQNFPIIFIGMINGLVLGGGLEVALACDIRVASETSKFAFPETSLGLIPGFGGTQRFLKQAGLNNALYYMLTGTQFSAQKAQELGLLQEVHSSNILEKSTMELIKKILHNGPNAILKIKKLLYQSLDTSLLEGLREEQTIFSNLFLTNEPKEGISAFLEKRKPNFHAI